MFLNAGSRAFSTGVFQTPMNYPALTLVPMCLRIERHDRYQARGVAASAGEYMEV